MAPGVGMRLGRYELLARVGAGGMGEVFRARDHDLHRDVAVKFLPARFAADPDRLARFAREARAASSLNHPNIVTIHEVGQAERLPYIVMEFIEGETLRQAIRAGHMPTRRLLDIGVQVAEGLAKAHAAGIVHRDLKPENVMLTPDGFVKILDFGLAKLRSGPSSEGTEGSSSQTETDTALPHATDDGAILGTVSYMSPEQASGRPVDFRSDQFALGAILYEMATGHRAFRRESVVQTLTAIIEDNPRPLAEINPALPGPARWIVERCLAKDPRERYASTLDLAHELRSVLAHLGETTGAVIAPETRRPARHRLRPWHGVAAAVAIVVGLLAFPPLSEVVLERLHRLPMPSEKRIAVLPIHVTGGTPEDRAVCDGLMDYIVARLGMLERYQRNVSVVPAAEVKQSGVTSAQMAQRGLGVTLAVEVTVQRAGDQTILSVSLVDTARRRQLRAATRQFQTRDASLLDQAVDAVVSTLDLELGDAERSALLTGSTTVVEAASLYAQAVGRTPYQQAQTVLERADQQQAFEQVISLLNRALEFDPHYALAHAGLGRAYLGLYRLQKRPQDAELAEAHCQRARDLDPLIPQPWLTLGALHTLVGKTDQALDELNQALARDPGDGLVFTQIAFAYQRQNRLREAEETYRKALAAAPNVWTVYAYYGSFLAGRLRWVEAESAFRRARDLAPDNVYVLSSLGGIYQWLDRKADARAALEKSISLYRTGRALSNLGRLEFYEGRYLEAARLFEEAANKDPWDFRIWRNAGSAYAQAGKRPDSLRAYRRAVELGAKERHVDPASGSLAALVADCHALLGEKAEARRLLKEADRLEPESATVAELAAETLEDLGDREGALKWLGLAFTRGYPLASVEESVTFRQLRTDPRYEALKKVGLKPAGGPTQ